MSGNNKVQIHKKWRLAILPGAFLISAVIVGQAFYQTRAILAGFFQEERPLVITAPPVVLPPKVVSVTPKDGTPDVVLDIEDPIVVRFDKSAKDYAVDFRVEPAAAVVFENNQDKTEFHLLPKEPFQADQEYTLKVFAKFLGKTGAGEQLIGKSSFKTLPAPPKTWSADLGERLAQARRFAHPLRTEGKYIDVNVENQVMLTYENGKLLDAYLVSTGRAALPTPKGTYSIHNKARRPWSKAYHLYMPYWNAITADGKIGIHELPEWPSGYKEGANHLGTPISHGCIRLGVGPAKIVFDWADVGTPVIVH